MLTYSDYFKPISAQNTFFAGANTPKGFVCDYDSYFSENESTITYVLKGGPGTGKSTFMKRMAESAKECGSEIIYIRCSSDPDSLDAVVLKKGNVSISVLDGTAPHIVDPSLPGASGEIINLGECWRRDMLEGARDVISESTREKGRAFHRAYNYLGAAGEIIRLQEGLSISCIDNNKMKKAIERLFPLRCESKKMGKVRYRRTCAVSMKGCRRLTSFESAGTLFAVRDYSFISPRFYSALLDHLIRRSIDCDVSVSPLGYIAELYLPAIDTAVVPYRDGMEYSKVINLRRFADKEMTARVKERRQFSSKCLTAMLEGAEECLYSASRKHYELEAVYAKAMDYSRLDEMTNRVRADIIKRLNGGAYN